MKLTRAISLSTLSEHVRKGIRSIIGLRTNAVLLGLHSMEEYYGVPFEGELPCRDSTNEDMLDVLQSYHEAVEIHCQKHSDSLYSDPLLRKQVLHWCLHVVREEGVRFPNVSRSDAAARGRDELVLCLTGD